MIGKPGDVNRWFRQLNRGNAQAADELTPLIYNEVSRK